MKVLFSEARSDYGHYIFPYAIWAIPEAGERPSQIFAQGFLPASRELDRYYMCRQIRVQLSAFTRSSENRRILRKCKGIRHRLVPRDEFDFSPRRRDFCKTYADIKFGKDVMTYARLDGLMNSQLISHVLVFEDTETGQEVGLATLFIEGSVLVYYYYAFYDLGYYNRNLGMFMMTSCVDRFAAEKHEHLYLGTCYSTNALYKTQFAGFQFFNGFCWSTNLAELKHLIARDSQEITQHLVESEDFQDRLYHGSLENIIAAGGFSVSLAR